MHSAYLKVPIVQTKYDAKYKHSDEKLTVNYKQTPHTSKYIQCFKFGFESGSFRASFLLKGCLLK